MSPVIGSQLSTGSLASRFLLREGLHLPSLPCAGLSGLLLSWLCGKPSSRSKMRGLLHVCAKLMCVFLYLYTHVTCISTALQPAYLCHLYTCAFPHLENLYHLNTCVSVRITCTSVSVNLYHVLIKSV